MSHLDYTNIILFDVTDKAINKLQRVKNWAVKVILIKSKCDSSIKARKTLHWLPIQERIEFKLLVIVYSCLRGDAPIYLKMLLKITIVYGNLRSNASMKLTVPYVKNNTFANKAFSVAGPRLWNSLLHIIRNINDLSEFKISLKNTYSLTHTVIMIITSITNYYINCKACMILYIY